MSEKGIHFDYRPEIDGLRAIAVVPVILFHAGYELFGGGFVGVDVFFVISGYLISSIIMSELDVGKFSIVKFYERRARRILPALFFVMACCIPFAWALLTPPDMEDFSKSVIAVATFSSNILFWRQSGYFDTAAELKPLLHTWSLAVEEQYYVIFPIILMLTWRFGRRWVIAILAVGAVLSLAAAEWGAANYPGAAFFLLPTRAWELLIGVFAAFYVAHRGAVTRSNALSLIGLAMVCFSIFVFDRNTPFPSLYALVPTVGVALILTTAASGTMVNWLLSTRPFVGIGLISYSAYLWHQPMLAFARHRFPAEVPPALVAALCVLSVVFAYFSWRYIERPFRAKDRISRAMVFRSMGALTGVFILLGLGGYAASGFDYRLTPEQRYILSFRNYERSQAYREGKCFLGPKQTYKDFADECFAKSSKDEVVIWGDSHAAALSYGLRERFPDVTQFSASACPPFKDVDFWDRPHCRAINDFVLQKIAERKPAKVIIHANWYLNRNLDPVETLEKTIDYVRTVSPGSEVLIVGGVPRWMPDLPTLMISTRAVLTSPSYMENDEYDAVAAVDDKLRQMAQRINVPFLSPTEVLCEGHKCLIAVADGKSVVPTAWDTTHLTTAGSVYLVAALFH